MPSGSADPSQHEDFWKLQLLGGTIGQGWIFISQDNWVFSLPNFLPASSTKPEGNLQDSEYIYSQNINWFHPCNTLCVDTFSVSKKFQYSFSLFAVAAGYHGPGRETPAFVELSGLPDHVLSIQMEKPISTVCCTLVPPPSANLLQALERTDLILLHSTLYLLIPKAWMWMFGGW